MKKLSTVTRFTLSAVFALTACGLLHFAVFGQTASNIVKADLSQAEIDSIVRKFTQNEGLFRQALNVYAFNRNAKMQTIGMGGQVTGTYARDSYLTFNEAGERFEKILYAPVSTLKLTVTASDLDHLGGLDPFAIEPRNVDKYKFTYLGKEKIDELNLHVFEVQPKVMPEVKRDMQRLFSGRVWVDDQDLMIVKSKGKAVPEGKERFPVVETWRENIDGKYWFPSYSSSDDELVFDNGYAVQIKFRITYKDYRLGRTDVKIVGEEDVPEEKPVVKKP